MEKGSESRVAMKEEVKRKKKASQSKKTKRKYRALEEAKAAEATAMFGGGSQDEVDPDDDGEYEGKGDATGDDRPEGQYEDERPDRERPPDPPRI